VWRRVHAGAGMGRGRWMSGRWMSGRVEIASTWPREAKTNDALNKGTK
jgi:hypothetical protein